MKCNARPVSGELVNPGSLTLKGPTPVTRRARSRFTLVGAAAAALLATSAGTASAQEVEPFQGPFKSWSVSLPVAPPAPSGRSADNAIAQFYIPHEPGAGSVRIGAFISDRTIEAALPVIGGRSVPVRIFGNDRTYDSNFDANRTKYTLDLNYESGIGTAWAAPTCVEVTFPVTREACHGALDINDTHDGSQLLTRIRDGGQDETLDVQYREKVSLIEDIPGLNSVAAAIDGSLAVTIRDDRTACISGTVDTFPSVEAYQYRPEQPVRTIFQTPQSVFGPPVLGPKPPGKNLDACAS